MYSTNFNSLGYKLVYELAAFFLKKYQTKGYEGKWIMNDVRLNLSQK